MEGFFERCGNGAALEPVFRFGTRFQESNSLVSAE